jgi:hypothetical protein
MFDLSGLQFNRLYDQSDVSQKLQPAGDRRSVEDVEIKQNSFAGFVRFAHACEIVRLCLDGFMVEVVTG